MQRSIDRSHGKSAKYKMTEFTHLRYVICVVCHILVCSLCAMRLCTAPIDDRLYALYRIDGNIFCFQWLHVYTHIINSKRRRRTTTTTMTSIHSEGGVVVAAVLYYAILIQCSMPIDASKRTKG